jgi:hypothetical protein
LNVCLINDRAMLTDRCWHISVSSVWHLPGCQGPYTNECLKDILSSTFPNSTDPACPH